MVAGLEPRRSTSPAHCVGAGAEAMQAVEQGLMAVGQSYNSSACAWRRGSSSPARCSRAGAHPRVHSGGAGARPRAALAWRWGRRLPTRASPLLSSTSELGHGRTASPACASSSSHAHPTSRDPVRPKNRDGSHGIK